MALSFCSQLSSLKNLSSVLIIKCALYSICDTICSMSYRYSHVFSFIEWYIVNLCNLLFVSVEGDEGEYLCKLDLNNGVSYNETVLLNSECFQPIWEDKTISLTNLWLIDLLSSVSSSAPLPEVQERHPRGSSPDGLQSFWLSCPWNFLGEGRCSSWLFWWENQGNWRQKPLLSLSSAWCLVILYVLMQLGNFTTENGVLLVNGTIRIENLDFADRAEYSCFATNTLGTNNATVLVRVKGQIDYFLLWLSMVRNSESCISLILQISLLPCGLSWAFVLRWLFFASLSSFMKNAAQRRWRRKRDRKRLIICEYCF